MTKLKVGRRKSEGSMAPIVNNPLPTSLKSECKKVARVLTSFVDPKQAFGPDKVIPPEILSQAAGLAVITVIKAGFLFSGRVGSGLVIARLEDGSWSAPSAIATAGMGFGGQIGAEITDFVMILNNRSAVQTFAQAGSVSLGGNLSIAAGPVGRNAEASGNASLGSVAAVFSYSKTKGLFAGVSLEGSVIVERRDANRKFYNSPVTAKQILSGSISAGPAADPLYRALNSRAFRGGMGHTGDEMYNDMPVYGEGDEEIWQGQSGSGYGEGERRSDRYNQYDEYVDGDEHNSYYNAPYRSSNDGDSSSQNRGVLRFNSTYRDYPDEQSKPPQRPPSSTKPNYGTKLNTTTDRLASLGPNQALALYNFEAERADDLGFRKGDIITITKRTDSQNDWWKGQKDGKVGSFPANYVAIR